MPSGGYSGYLGTEVSNFNIVCATLGGFIICFGLVSFLLKERAYLSEAVISLVAGVIFSPHATNLIRPLDYALGDTETLETITLYFCRLVLGVQLVLAGVQLPSRYLKTEWRSLSLLLGPGMCGMWMTTSLLVWGLVPDINFVQALAVGACVTPTDPVLSNTIVKGKFADMNIPKELQKIIIAESGANDGLGYPFLFLPLYILQYATKGTGGLFEPRHAVGLWFGQTWGYTIFLSVFYGWAVGWIAKELLHWAEKRDLVDRESFLVFAITLALFIVGTVGLIGSDDVLACFIAGNAFTWDDWFRLETMDDSLQPTIDMLLNVTIFIWFGAVCPWPSFNSDVVPIYRLVILGVLVLALRRLPIVLALHSRIHQIESIRTALFTGFFGPVGVSAVFYLYIARQFLTDLTGPDGAQREDARRLSDVLDIVVWFLVICSIVVHGISIPLGKVGLTHIPRAISLAISSERTSVSPPNDARVLTSPSTTTARAQANLPRWLAPSSSQSRSRSQHNASSVATGSSARAPSALRTAARFLVLLFTGTNREGQQKNPARAASVEGPGNISAPADGRALGRVVSRSEQDAPRPEGNGRGSGEKMAQDDGQHVDSRDKHEQSDVVTEKETDARDRRPRRAVRFGDEDAPSVATS